jgi:hypothetical protein
LANPTQTQILRMHFRYKPTITPLEARTLYRIESLSRRICDLKASGYKFVKRRLKDLTGKAYTVYSVV